MTWEELNTDFKWSCERDLSDWEVPSVRFVEARLPGDTWLYPPKVLDNAFLDHKDDLRYKDLSLKYAGGVNRTASGSKPIPSLFRKTVVTSTEAATAPVNAATQATITAPNPTTNGVLPNQHLQLIQQSVQQYFQQFLLQYARQFGRDFGEGFWQALGPGIWTILTADKDLDETSSYVTYFARSMLGRKVWNCLRSLGVVRRRTVRA